MHKIKQNKQILKNGLLTKTRHSIISNNQHFQQHLTVSTKTEATNARNPINLI